jgi:hypothetical protein
MLRQMLLSLISFLMLSQSSLFGQTDQLPTYENVTAYEVYSAILSSQFAGSQNFVIRLETRHKFFIDTKDEPRICLRPDAESEPIIGTAIADYINVNKTKWRFQENFKLEDPYQLVSSNVLDSIFKTTGWKGFREKYPSSLVTIGLSAVGFNAEKTVAVVYMERQGGRSEGEYYVFQKENGKWLPLTWNGQRCGWIS